MLARFFIDRPVFAWVLSLVIILIGLVAAFMLPIDMYPPITPPTIQVTARYPGADAQVVANVIAAPIEQQINGVENMLYMSSQSTNDGNYSLTVTFQIGTDINTAQVLVQNRVALAMPQMPSEVQVQGISVRKTSPNILFAINLISPDGRYDDLYLSNYATVHLRDELARIEGVGDVRIFGERDYSMRIWLDPAKLASRNLTSMDVVNAVRGQNVQVAAGQIGQEPAPKGQRFQYPLTALGRLESVQQFGNIIVKTGSAGGTAPAAAPPARNGKSSSGSSSSNGSGGNAAQTTPPANGAAMMTTAARAIQPSNDFSTPIVRIRDIAEIEMGAQNYDQTSRLDGQPAAGIGIFQLPGSNALEVADAAKRRIEELKADFPPGLEYRILYDTTPFIRQSVDDVFRTLIEAVLLVAFVVLLFLQDWKAMILPMIDVPVSLIGTCAVFALMGFTFNNLTLFGLVLAIGIVVDDAIVVLENIERHIAAGLPPREATIAAMGEITGPIIAITLVLCSVFIPSIFIPGLTGQFYRQFAVTISSAMIISAVNALTLTPSRAVTIFQTEQSGERGELRHEALPWWIFGVIGGLISYWLARRYLAGISVLAPPSQLALSGLPKWQSWAILAGYFLAYFIPGAIIGGAVGWFIISPINRALGWLFGRYNRFFDWVTGLYGRFVARLLRLAAVVVLIYLGLLVLTGWQVATVPKGFIPTQDQGYLLINVQLPDSASLQRTEAVLAQVDQIARDTPGVAHTVGIGGMSFVLGTAGSNLGSMFVVLDPWDQRHGREQYDAAITQKIQMRCGREVKDAIVSVFRPPPLRGLGNAGGFQLQVEQRGFVDLNQLQAQTDQFIQDANRDPNFAGVFTLFRANTPQMFVDIDRAKAQSLHVPVDDVFTTLQVEMGSLFVNQINLFGRTWQVQLQAAPKFRSTTDQVGQLQVRNTDGGMVPLSTLAKVRLRPGPVSVMRYNGYTSAAINGNSAPGVSSGTSIQDVTRLANQHGIKFEWTGITYLEVEAGNITLLIFAFGTILVYFVLAAKYESWSLPLAVILVVPLCMLAAVAGMMIARLPVDIFVQIGLLVLVGLASKNAILIVEYGRQLHLEGKDARESAIEASRIRFRPIIMTSLAFIFGVIPLVFATGAGKEMRQSLGIAVFAGMIGVTLFGVLLTPTFYFLLMRGVNHGQDTAAGRSG